MTRTGKIARLPHDIRTQLNTRLRDGVPGCKLVEWLNSSPEVQAVLHRHFEGRPICERNLSEWRQGGYREWLTQQDAFDKIAELGSVARQLATAAPDHLVDDLTTLIATHYAAQIVALNSDPNAKAQLTPREVLELSRLGVELQRGKQNAARIKIEQARLELDKEKTEENITDQFIQWLEYPKVRDCIRDETATPKDLRDRLRKLFGLEPEPSSYPPEDTEHETYSA